MCGINGVIRYRGEGRVDMAALTRVRDAMALRGPDGFGAWRADTGRIAFGHRRLSIIDLHARSDQPLVRADAQAAIVFNGEIYNYQQLRAELIATGVTLHTSGDTEVVMELLLRDGPAGLKKLRGMYALAFADLRDHSVLLARDPYGIKPLYFADDGTSIKFASSVKALLEDGAISKVREPAGEVGFLLYGSVPEPFTCYQAIRALAPGHVLQLRDGTAPHLRAVNLISEAYAAPESDLSVADLQEAITQSVRAHLVADVPVGAFLSAGVDSGALVGLARQASDVPLSTLTIRFEEFSGMAQDEGPLARDVARLYGTEHKEHIVTAGDFDGDFANFMRAMDQPSIDGVNTWFVSKAMHQMGRKVALSGLGGDELLGGYSSFSDISRWQQRAWMSRLPAAEIWATMARSVTRLLGMHPKAAGFFELAGSFHGLYLLKRGLFLPHELPEFVGKEHAVEGWRVLQASQSAPKGADDFARVAELESSMYMRNQLLRDTDWASMAHSLEVRTPLVDARLLMQCMPARAQIQKHGGKQLLGTAAKKPLPSSLIKRPKTGFTTPVAQWQQSNTHLNGWRQFKSLQPSSTPWARRYALAIAEYNGMRLGMHKKNITL
jgi:asparagine synthase (glutamine-hydrolysing)